MSLGWQIISRTTGQRVTQRLFLTRELAEAFIAKEQDRYDRGTRKFTREQLLDMTPSSIAALAA